MFAPLARRLPTDNYTRSGSAEEGAKVGTKLRAGAAVPKKSSLRRG
jgi:hypothetical protein